MYAIVAIIVNNLRPGPEKWLLSHTCKHAIEQYRGKAPIGKIAEFAVKKSCVKLLIYTHEFGHKFKQLTFIIDETVIFYDDYTSCILDLQLLLALNVTPTIHMNCNIPVVNVIENEMTTFLVRNNLFMGKYDLLHVSASGQLHILHQLTAAIGEYVTIDFIVGILRDIVIQKIFSLQAILRTIGPSEVSTKLAIIFSAD